MAIGNPSHEARFAWKCKKKIGQQISGMKARERFKKKRQATLL